MGSNRNVFAVDCIPQLAGLRAVSRSFSEGGTHEIRSQRQGGSHTGASTGIGAAAALAFARHGSKLVIHYNASRTQAEAVAAEAKAAGAEAILVGGDVTKGADVKRIVAETLAAYGRIDILINNAGGMIGRTKIEDYTEEYLGKVLALNVTQVALFMREVIPVMRKQQGGNVINVSSIAARHGGGGARSSTRAPRVSSRRRRMAGPRKSSATTSG